MAFAFPDAARRPTVGIQFIRTSLGVGREATRYKDAGLAERGLLKRWGRAGLWLPQAVVPPRQVLGQRNYEDLNIASRRSTGRVFDTGVGMLGSLVWGLAISDLMTGM